MTFNVCSKCKKPIVYEDGKPVSSCLCAQPTFPWECDEDIYHLLVALWDKGYDTKFSCSGHSISRFYSNTGKCTVFTDIDINGYITIPGACVRVNDLEKYKYGCAYIEKTSTLDVYTEQMSMFMSLPDNYIVTDNDPIFNKYLEDYVSGEDAKLILHQVKNPEIWYTIRTDIDIKKDQPLKAYTKLMESRIDMAKLIDLLPCNVKEGT
jgi:hypothetical protein